MLFAKEEIRKGVQYSGESLGGLTNTTFWGRKHRPVVEPLRGRFSAFSPSVGPLRSLLLFRRPMYFLWRPSCHSVASHAPRRSPPSHLGSHALLHDKQQRKGLAALSTRRLHRSDSKRYTLLLVFLTSFAIGALCECQKGF